MQSLWYACSGLEFVLFKSDPSFLDLLYWRIVLEGNVSEMLSCHYEIYDM